MKLEDSAQYTEKCFSGDLPPCSGMCPFSLDIRSFTEKVESGKFNAAYKMLRSAVVFPVIVSELCPSYCENNCQRRIIGDEPIAVRLLESACIEFSKNQKPSAYTIPQKAESIAVVGAGSAGLSAALCLSQKKYQVTVFDKNSGWGGFLRDLPLFERFDNDIALQFSASDAQFVFEREISSLDELSGYNMIYIATGADGDDFGLLPGWDSDNLSTERSGVFLGGALTGTDTVKGIAQGKALSKTADFFVQTGRANVDVRENTKEICRYCPPIDGVSSKQRIIPSGAFGYSEDESILEAARCLKCDCNACMASCEMLAMYKKKPKKIAMEVFTDTNVNPPFSHHTLTRQAYSCNMCGHCTAICPADVDIGGVLRLSREARTGDSAYPEALHDYWLREMDFSAGEASFFAAVNSSGKCEYVFYPGCQLGAHNPLHVLKSFEFMKNNYNSGVYVGCCGAPAYWAGDTKRHTENNERIYKVWLEMNKPIFVFACATCESLFKLFLPEVQRISLYELMKKSLDHENERVFEQASVFDPCNSRENEPLEEAVRFLATKSGIQLYELPEKNRCCGYGGHMSLANPELYDKIA